MGGISDPRLAFEVVTAPGSHSASASAGIASSVVILRSAETRES